MHLSLKGSLIRSPMLNRVGQRLLQLFEGASAAYSLRDLASNIASVVRVRRASDNSEKDFSAADVSSGAMTQWVNGQVVPPLDVRELVDGERTGALIPAAAAYSLRNLSTGYTGNVVDVRRSSDDAEESFTAAEVADGTLEDWVNESVSFTAGNIFFSSSETLINESSTAFEATSNGGTFDVRAGGQNYTDIVSGEVTVTLTASNFSSSQSIDFEAWTPTGTSTYITAGTITGNGDYTFTFNVTEDGAGSIFRFRGLGLTSGDTLSVSNLSLSYTKASGFVTQWYDQSGNGNHATQGTNASQPKIVDGGSLVSGGLDFDGVNDKLSFDSSVSLSTNDFYFASVISILDGNREDITPVGNAAGNRFLISLDYDNDAAQMRANDGTFLTQPFTRVVPANETLVSISTVSNTATLRCEGISAAVFNTTGESFTLGSMGQINPSTYSKHSIKELIIYDSDQSDNRTAFEANIGETYGIDLPSGVDTGYDQVDGFVETWYDQSGNGNDAVQQVSGKQPKIVDAGVLVSEGGKPAFNVDGVDDVLELGSAITNVGDFYVSLVSVMEETSGLQAILGADTNTDYLRAKDSTWLLYTGTGAGDTGNVGWSAPFDSRYLMSFNRSGSTVTAQLNGSSAGTGTNGTDIGFITKLFQRGSNTTQLWKGNVQELIIYDSDQSANRPAIEANINNQYDIY